MANFANLKAAINAVIKANGQREITGEIMNQVLTAMVNSLGSNYQFAGVATPSTNPGTPDQNVFYMATQAGTYTNFSAIVLQAGISILLWDGSWSSETFFTVDSVPTAGSNNFITSGAVFDKMKLDGGAYDVTAHNNNATFADLSALLNSENLNTLIPDAVRHGGMSIKFVQSSDNKYVQCLYHGTSTAVADFTNTNNWERINLEKEVSQLGQGKSDNFIIADLPYRNRLIEAYFTGLNNTHIYSFKYLKYYVSGTYKVVQVHLIDETTNTIVALVEQATETDYIGVLNVTERNSSGINGYVLVDVKTTDIDNFTNTLNIAKASVLENSPLLREYLYPHILESQYDSDKSVINGKFDTLNQEVLNVSIFKTVSDRTLLRRIKQIRLYGVSQNESYELSTCKYYVSGDYKAYQIYIVNSNNVRVCLLELQATTDVAGIYKLSERNNSGVYGYVYLNMLTTDTQNMTAVLNMGEVFAYEQLYTPPIAESLPFASITPSTGLGNYRKDGSSSFSAVTGTIIAGFQNIVSNIDGVIKSISFRSKGTSMKFGIGIIDQRNIAVIRKTFELNCIADTLNTIDLEKQGIQIYQGETLFVIFSSSSSSICFTGNESTTADVQMVYGSEGGVLNPLATTYGGRLNLYWEVAEIESPFAFKEDIINVSEKADAANELASEALSNFGLVKDRQGNYYQLMVVNGAISIIPLIFKKVLVICNSIGVNGRVYAQGWCGRRGMASSRNGLDYKTHLENGLKQKNANAVVVLRNVWNWEQDFDSITPADLMEGYLDSDVDCIIFRAGENVPSGRIEDFQENLTDLLNYCISQCPNANLFITSMVWANEGKDAALQNTALSMGVPLIDVSSSDAIYKERIGDYLEGDYTPDGGTTWDTTQQVLYKVLTSGIATHTNDVGMLRIANNILTAMKYEQLELLHNINIGDTGGYTCSIITNRWVVGGIVNVMSNGNTVSVVDSDNTTVAVTNHNDGVFTFIMPDKDVTITAS